MERWSLGLNLGGYKLTGRGRHLTGQDLTQKLVGWYNRGQWVLE
jgi:hypothetical protein